MRLFTRRVGDTITIGLGTPHEIRIRVTSIKEAKVVVGVLTNKAVSILRTEDITDEQYQAARLSQHMDKLTPTTESELNDSIVAEGNVS